MFWENYANLCKQNEMSPNKAASEMGFSSGSVTAWKNGRLPRKAVLSRVAEYFNVSVEDLLSKQEKPAEDSEPKSKYDAEFIELWDTFSDEQKKAAIEFMKMFGR